MAGFDDLLLLAQPFVHTEEMSVVAGSAWRWGYSMVDDYGDPVDMTSGFTGGCTVKDESDNTLITVPVTFPAAGFAMCTADGTSTADVPPGTHHHQVVLTRNSDAARLLLIYGPGSSIIVLPKGS